MYKTETCKVSTTQYKKGYCTKVLQACERALSVQPKLVTASLLKAQCLVNMGELIEARKTFAKTLRLDPTNFNAWLEAGDLCKQMGELDQAAIAYQQAMDVAPERYESHLALALVMAKQGKSEPTNEAYHKAVNLATAMGDEALGQVHWQMGQCMLEQGHAQESLACFAFALESSKTQSDAGPLNFAAEVLARSSAVLVDVWASWCGPCRAFAPIFEKASDAHADIRFGKVDTEAEQALAAAEAQAAARCAKNGGLLFSEAEINAFNEIAAEVRKPKWALADFKVAV